MWHVAANGVAGFLLQVGQGGILGGKLVEEGVVDDNLRAGFRGSERCFVEDRAVLDPT